MRRGEMFDFIVSQKRVAEVQACKFFHQIVEGVDELHKNEITHRDLKPEVSQKLSSWRNEMLNHIFVLFSESFTQSFYRWLDSESCRLWPI